MAAWLYGALEANERHRHRYEVNPDMVQALEERACARFVGHDDSKVRMEILELQEHPFFFATQFHPEYKTRPGRPSPPFLGFLMAAAGMPLDRSSVQRQVEHVRNSDPWAATLESENELMRGVLPMFRDASVGSGLENLDHRD